MHPWRRSCDQHFLLPLLLRDKPKTHQHVCGFTRRCRPPRAHGWEPTTTTHTVPIGCAADAESLAAERLIGVRRRGRRSGGLHQTSRILSLGRNAVVERSLAEPPCSSWGVVGSAVGVRLVGDGAGRETTRERWKTSLLALLTSSSAHNPVKWHQLRLFRTLSGKLP